MSMNLPKDSATNPWHEILHARLRGSPYPLFDFQDHIIPAASIWTGSREWVTAFRKASLQPGDRIALLLPPSSTFLAVLTAALWEGLSIALYSPDTATDAALLASDARLVVSHSRGQFVWNPTASTSPPLLEHLPPLRSAVTLPQPDARFLLRTSGTSGSSRTVALSDAGILSVIRSHLPLLDMDDAVVLSVLPWHHSFGLVLDLLASVVAGALVCRDPLGGRNAAQMINLIARHGVTHLNTVPRTISLLLAADGGRSALESLRGGTVGGAPASVSIAAGLAGTRLRSGYGQTEASPGIALGPPGVWTAGYLGHAVGCETKITSGGTLAFRGENACLGYFSPQTGLDRCDPGRWVDTRDYVEVSEGGFHFCGRADDSFKLANGRVVDAALLETQLRRELPGTDELMVFTDDGERLHVAVSTLPGWAPPSRADVASLLGHLSVYLGGLFPVAPGRFDRTPKGAIDRRRIMESVGLHANHRAA